MFCRFCGSALADESSFCHSCGRALAPVPARATTGTAAVPAVVPVKPSPPKTKIPATVGRVAFGVFLIAGVLWWAMSRRASDSGSSSPPTLRQLVAQPRMAVLSNAEFALSASQYRYIRFEVPQNATTVRVEGTFSASGGLRNDVEAYIFSNDDFVNWQNKASCAHVLQQWSGHARHIGGRAAAHCGNLLPRVQ